jgi:hypothetical protein
LKVIHLPGTTPSTSNEAKYKLKTMLNIKARSSYPNERDSFLGTVTDGIDVPVSQQLKLTRKWKKWVGWGTKNIHDTEI